MFGSDISKNRNNILFQYHSELPINNIKNEITLFINSFGSGGSEKVSVTLANAFYNNNINLNFLVLNLNKPILKDKLNSNIKVFSLNVLHSRYCLIPLYLYLKKHKETSFLVFNHELAIILVFFKIILFRKIKIISRNINTLSRQQLHQKSIWHGYIKNIFLKKLYHRVDQIIVQSKNMGKDLLKNYNIHERKITVIHNPLSEEYENYELKERIIRNEEILYVGRLTAQKGLFYLLNAFLIIHNTYPKLRLRIIGEGELYNKLFNYVRDHNISKNVLLEGFKDKLVTYYSNAKVTVLSSIYEGFPNVLIESIAIGTPVVSFDCPSGPSEIIVEGVNGFLVEYLNTKQLAEKILLALNKDWDRNKIVETSKQYRIKPILKQYLKLIDKN